MFSLADELELIPSDSSRNFLGVWDNAHLKRLKMKLSLFFECSYESCSRFVIFIKKLPFFRDFFIMHFISEPISRNVWFEELVILLNTISQRTPQKASFLIAHWLDSNRNRRLSNNLKDIITVN